MEQKNDIIDVRRYLRMIREGKWFYAICIAGALALSLVYLIGSKPVFRNYAGIMVENDAPGGGGLSSILGGNSIANFAIAGLMSSTIDDEMELLMSHECHVRTARLMQLNRTYLEREGLHKNMLYKTSPVLVEAPAEYFDTCQTMTLQIRLEGQGRCSVKLSKGFMGWQTLAVAEHQELPFTLTSEAGDLHLVRTPYYTDDAEQAGRTIQVKIASNTKVAWANEKTLKVEPVNKKANAIRLNYNHPEKQYAYDLLSTQIACYRAMRSEHKDDQKLMQVEFLDRRIAQVMTEMDSVRDDIKRFYADRDLVDVGQRTGYLVKRTEVLKDSLIRMQTHHELSRRVLEVLESQPDGFPLITASTGSSLISQYNHLVMQRNQLLLSAREGNAALETNTKQLTQLREKVIEQMKFSMSQASFVQSRLQSLEATSASELGAMPTMGFEYRQLQQDLGVRNNLLIFLLQERENNMMSVLSQSLAGFAYDSPYTLKQKDHKKQIILTALLLFMALAGPTVLLWLRMWWQDRLRDDSDLPYRWRQVARSDVNDLRRLIMATPYVEQLYTQPLAGAEALLPEVVQCFEEAASDAPYRFTAVDDLEKLKRYSDCRLGDSERLLLLVPADQMTRQAFRQQVQGLNPDYCFVLVK